MSTTGLVIEEEFGKIEVTLNNDGNIDIVQKGMGEGEDHVVFHPCFVLPFAVWLLNVIREDPTLMETPMTNREKAERIANELCFIRDIGGPSHRIEQILAILNEPDADVDVEKLAEKASRKVRTHIQECLGHPNELQLFYAKAKKTIADALRKVAQPESVDVDRLLALLSIPHSSFEEAHYQVWYEAVQGFLKTQKKVNLLYHCHTCGVGTGEDTETCEICGNIYCDDCLPITDDNHSVCWGCIRSKEKVAQPQPVEGIEEIRAKLRIADEWANSRCRTHKEYQEYLSRLTPKPSEEEPTDDV